MSQTITFDVQLMNPDVPVEANVIAALAALFKKSELQIEQLLERAPVIVKKQVTEEQAARYKQALEKAGAKVELIPNQTAAHEQWSLEPTPEELAQEQTEQQQASVDPTGKASFAVRDVQSEAERAEAYRAHGAPDVVSEPADDFYAAPAAGVLDESDYEFEELSLREIYFKFDGRINRSTYWLKYVLPMIGCGLLLAATAFISTILFVVLMFAAIIPYIWIGFAVTIKRLHDVNLSGWWYGGLVIASFVTGSISAVSNSSAAVVLDAITGLGGLAIFVLNGFIPGTKGRNNYGNPQA